MARRLPVSENRSDMSDDLKYQLRLTLNDGYAQACGSQRRQDEALERDAREIDFVLIEQDRNSAE